jgi:hypothetical protein
VQQALCLPSASADLKDGSARIPNSLQIPGLSHKGFFRASLYSTQVLESDLTPFCVPPPTKRSRPLVHTHNKQKENVLLSSMCVVFPPPPRKRRGRNKGEVRCLPATRECIRTLHWSEARLFTPQGRGVVEEAKLFDIVASVSGAALSLHVTLVDGVSC